MIEKNDNLKKFITDSKEYKVINFKDVVKSTSGKDVIQLNMNDINNKKLLDSICLCARNYIINSKQENTTINGKIRINEIGNLMERIFVDELIKNGIQARLLGKTGYPDIEINFNGIVYLECKASAKENCWTSPFRSFYYTEGKKITENAIHLLIGWKLEKIDSNYKVIGFKIVDLYNLNLYLRCEFNADNPGVYKNSIYTYSQ